MLEAWIAWCAVGLILAWSIWRDGRLEGRNERLERLTHQERERPLRALGSCTLELLDGDGRPLGIARSTTTPRPPQPRSA